MKLKCIMLLMIGMLSFSVTSSATAMMGQNDIEYSISDCDYKVSNGDVSVYAEFTYIDSIVTVVYSSKVEPILFIYTSTTTDATTKMVESKSCKEMCKPPNKSNKHFSRNPRDGIRWN